MCKIEEKRIRLEELLRSWDTVAVAFSGGVDSSCLLAEAKRVLGDRVIAITAQAPNFPEEEMEEAAEFCEKLGVRQIRIPLAMKDLEVIRHNPQDRCYHCKKAIFTRLLDEAGKWGASILADGTNADDLSDYRPGLLALSQLSVKSPLAEVGLTKAEIRELLHRENLPVWTKPAYACLATRIPTGEEITEEKLLAIGRAERELHRLGFLQVRVRHHGEVARIEILRSDRVQFSNPELWDQVDQAVKAAGFRFAALDLGGYRMGNMNSKEPSKATGEEDKEGR